MGSVLVTLGRCLYLLSSVSVWPYIFQEYCLTMAKIQTYSDKTKLITKNDYKNRPRDLVIFDPEFCYHGIQFGSLVPTSFG